MGSESSERQTALYRAVWRWHFLAGLLSLPFLLNLAVTGGLYLFTPEINHLLYHSLEDVPARGGAPLAASALVQRTAEATQSDVLSVTLPSAPDKSVQMDIQTPSGELQTAFADPYDGSLLGTIQYHGVMQIVRKIHSLQYFGFWASCLVEIAAGWTIVLALSGIFLWWPRGRGGGVVSVRGTPKSRMFWRDLHAVTGLFTSAVILFLAVTGMPWSLVWGQYVQDWTTAAGLSRPAPPAGIEPPSFRPPAGKARQVGHVHGGAPPSNLPWTLEKTVPPESTPDMRQAITLDQAVAALDKLGLPKPYSINLPQGPKAAFIANSRFDQVETTRVVYIDQYSGAVLDDVGFAQFGMAAKAIEWGIMVHQGQQYGFINRYLMLAGCIAIVVLTISAPVIWWKRRPNGSFGMPPAAANRRAALSVLAVMAIAGIIYPLVGLSMIAALLLERLYEIIRRTFERRPSPAQ
ncbi:MAG TPA: PepSY domain-containing protein [Methylocella sp.]|nr:PepSY domain-containing protein [Methylocella sp.]